MDDQTQAELERERYRLEARLTELAGIIRYESVTDAEVEAAHDERVRVAGQWVDVVRALFP